MNKENFKNIGMVFFSNVFSVLMAIVSGFFIPKFVSIETYGYIRLYLLYVGYVGFFHFGYINGLYLRYGNYDYENLPKEKFRLFTKVLISMQIYITIILIFLWLFFIKGKEESFSLLFVIINLLFLNMITYFSFINQFTKRFLLDSIFVIFHNFLNVIMFISIVIFKIDSHIYIISFYTFINFILFVILVVQNKGLIFGKKAKLNGIKTEIISFIKNGFFVMISEFIAIVILGIDSIFINNLYGLKEFAIYSFAVSVVIAIYSFINAISKVIFPYLVRVDKKHWKKYYIWMTNILLCVSLLTLLLYFPIKYILERYLLEYSKSIVIVGYLLPTVIFKILVVLVCGNFYKIMGSTKKFAINNLLALVLSFCLDCIAAIFIGTVDCIAIASVLSMALWYIAADLYFMKMLNIALGEFISKYIILFIMIIIYYNTIKMVWYKGITIYLFCFIINLIIFYRRKDNIV